MGLSIEDVFIFICYAVTFGVGLALLWLRWWYVNATQKKTSKYRSFKDYLIPDRQDIKRWLPIITGCLAWAAFPYVFGTLWLVFVLILIAIFVVGVGFHIGEKLLDGCSIKFYSNDNGKNR
jgi:hypothetical protein